MDGQVTAGVAEIPKVADQKIPGIVYGDVFPVGIGNGGGNDRQEFPGAIDCVEIGSAGRVVVNPENVLEAFALSDSGTFANRQGFNCGVGTQRIGSFKGATQSAGNETEEGEDGYRFSQRSRSNFELRFLAFRNCEDSPIRFASTFVWDSESVFQED